MTRTYHHITPRLLTAGATLAIALAAAPLTALAVDDEALAIKIGSELDRNRVTDHARIEVSSRDGFVTLTGAADSSHQKRLASEIARRFPGVTAVENRLRVVPEDAESR